MTRRLAVLLFLFFAIFSASAQEKRSKVAMPDIPGSFILDFGFNRAISPPEKFEQDFWGSRTVNVYYRYPLRFGKSKLSFVPSIGLSLERFKFSNNYTLSHNSEPDGSYSMVVANTTYPGTFKSMLITNYLDLPIGFRYDTKPEDIAGSLSIELGGRVGVLYQSFTKIKYTENNETKKIFDEQSHGLNPIRYGIYTRLGVGGFNFFWFYNLSPLFSANKGPATNATNPSIKTSADTFTFGISINGF